jgi:hypothetical protein
LVGVTGSDSPAYQWQVSTNAGGSWTNISGATASSYVVENTTLTQSGYLYRVAVTDGSNSVTSDAATLTVNNPLPDKPTSLAAAMGDGQASLSWTAPASIGQSALIDYSVQYRLTGQSTWETFVDGVSTATTATVTGLSNGRKYEFQVAARNTQGLGEYSDPATVGVASVVDSYLNFDGTFHLENANIGDASDPVYSLTEDSYTIEAWVYDSSTNPDGTAKPAGFYGILRLGTSSRIYLRTNYKGVGDNKVNFGLNSPGTTSTRTTDVSLPQDRWVHVALTRTENTNWRLYFDGVQVFEDSVVVNTGPFDAPLRIGTAAADGVQAWIGGIDQVKIWQHESVDDQDHRDAVAAHVTTSMYTYSDAGKSAVLDESVLRFHYDFNAINNASVVDTVIVSGKSSNLTPNPSTGLSAQFVDVKEEEVVDGRQVVSFPRSYLTAYGGWSVPTGTPTDLQYLVVGGGGGGGTAYFNSSSGGGGAGGLKEATLTRGLTDILFPVVVGQGGLGGPAVTQIVSGQSGGKSVFGAGALAVTADGGGGGGGSRGNGVAGASGGGAGKTSDSTVLQGGSRISGQGNVGGNSGSSTHGAGGGGGAGGAGVTPTSGAGGAGGLGVVSTLSGSQVTYAAGGAGGTFTGDANGMPGTPNSGNGGQGSSSPSSTSRAGGMGGSGIVIVSWELFSPPVIGTQPVNQSKLEGESATFTAAATISGSGTLPTSGSSRPMVVRPGRTCLAK